MGLPGLQFSKQQIIDCLEPVGLIPRDFPEASLVTVLNYCRDVGLTLESNYRPYESNCRVVRYCSLNQSDIVVKINNYLNISRLDEDVKEDFINLNVVIGALDPYPSSFNFGSEGVYTDPTRFEVESKVKPTRHVIAVTWYGTLDGVCYYEVLDSTVLPEEKSPFVYVARSLIYPMSVIDGVTLFPPIHRLLF